MLVPRDWSVQVGHDLLERLEQDLRDAVSGSVIFTHLEPLDDPAAWKDIGLDRSEILLK
jgi:divalent metal cation (Fe/Co/Zn/Cd) transporter